MMGPSVAVRPAETAQRAWRDDAQSLLTRPTTRPPARTPARTVTCPAAPRVLVIVTCYNYASFVARALDSVAAQSYQDWTCVIVDDNSPDDSARIIAGWILERDDPRFRLIRKSANAGQLAAIATGLAAEADGQFVALLDADDVWFPEHLAMHVDVHLHRIGYAAFTCSDMAQIDASDRLLAGTVHGEGFFAVPRRPRSVAFTATPTPTPDRPLPSEKLALLEAPGPAATFVKPDIFRWHWSATSAMVFRRAMLELVLPDPVPPVPLCADHYLAHASHFFTGSILLDACLGGYRRHGANGFSSLAVYGTCAASAPFHDDRHNNANLKMMLVHILNRRRDFEAAFGARSVRDLVTALCGYQLRTEGRISDKRARRLLGPAGLAWAWWREHLRRLRPG